MNVEYVKDLHHNYLVISETDHSREDSYSVKMLQANDLEGVLKPDRRIIDNQEYFYYDITAKQALNNLYVKSAMTYKKVKRLFSSITDTIEKVYHYLLNEDDFILMPEYIYIDLATSQAYLCFLPGYHKNMKEQLGSLLEYIMNKVDYNDKEAVLLVYNLYAASREDIFTFDRITGILKAKAGPYDAVHQPDTETEPIGKNSTGTGLGERPAAGKGYRKTFEGPDSSKEVAENDKNDEYSPFQTVGSGGRKKAPVRPIPVMMEKICGEQEILCYPVKTYLITIACGLGSIFILLLAIKTKMIFNSLGNHIDYSKLFAFLLVIFSISGFFIQKVWNKKNKIAKIITKQEYIDPRQDDRGKMPLPIGRSLRDKNKEQKKKKDDQNQSDPFNVNNKYYVDEINEHNPMEKEHKNTDYKYLKNENTEEKNPESVPAKTVCSGDNIINPDEDDCNPTCLLNSTSKEQLQRSCRLKPVDEKLYETIDINEFPFFIGKLKKNMDYCLEKDVVSRYHAKITKEQDQFYLTDLNSTNGTFINGEILQSYQMKEINSGDEIAFADIKYRFTF